MKKALSAVLAVVLVLGVCFSVPMIASANDANDFTYRLNEGGDGYIITGVKNVNNVTGEVTIPKEYTLQSGEGFNDDGDVITITDPTNALSAEEPVVTFTAGENGTITATAQTGEEGARSLTSGDAVVAADKVVFTVEANEGYKVGTFTVDGEDAELTGNTYTINAIANDVTVVVTFVVDETQTFDVTVPEAANGCSVTAEPEAAYVGQTVTLTIVTAEGYQLDDISAGEGVKLTGSGATRTFTMPAKAVEVTATFSLIPATEYAIDITATTNGTVTAKIGDETVTSAEEGAKVVLSVVPAEGYEIDEITVTPTEAYNAETKTITMPESDVTVTATFKKANYTITLNDVTDVITLAVPQGAGLTANYGDKVTIYVVAGADYVVKGLTIAGVEDIEAVTGELPTGITAGYTFTMPAADVSVSADYANKYNSVNIAEAVKDYVKVTTAADKEGKFEYNKSVTVKVTAPNGFELKTLTVDGQAVEVNAQNEYTFTITKDVAVNAEFQAKALPVVGIDEGAFAGCTGITSFKLAADQTNFVVTDGVLFVGTTLLAFPANYGTETEAEEKYTIPETVTKIAKNAFESLGAIDYVFYNGNIETLTVAEGNTALTETVFHKGMTTHEKAEDATGEVTQAPNCTYTGVRTFYCKVCNVPVETAVEPVNAEAHVGGAWYTVTSADCTDAGEEAQDCVLCTALKVNTRATEALGHTESDWIVTDATCTAAGEKHKDCTVCGEEIEGSSTPINALGHKISDPDVVVKATCTEDGYVEGICDNCNTKQKIDEAKKGHKMITVVDAKATCTVAGSQHEECETCGYMDEDAVIGTIPALGHSKAEETAWTIVTEATCAEAGLLQKFCDTCHTPLTDKDGKEITRVLEATGEHEYKDYKETKAPTCTEKGAETGTCACGATDVREVKALGHEFAEEFTTDKEATCTEAGSKSKHCTRTGCQEKSEVTVIPVIPHTADETWKTVEGKAATCYAEGEKTGTCAVCKTENCVLPIEKLAHTWAETAVPVVGTITKENVPVLDAEGKPVLDEVTGEPKVETVTYKAATCEEAGYTVKYCTDENCGAYDETSLTKVDKLGHDFDETHDTEKPSNIQPTCDEVGYKFVWCKTCSEANKDDENKGYVKVEVAATGHDWEEKAKNLKEEIEIEVDGEKVTAKAPDCENPGYTAIYCATCGDYKDVTPVAKLGHSVLEENWTTESEATCIALKVEKNTCNRCDEKVTREVGKLADHDFSETKTTVYPTCEEDGVEYYACKQAGCKARNQEKVLEALGHDHGDNKLVGSEPTCTTAGVKTQACTRIFLADGSLYVPKTENDEPAGGEAGTEQGGTTTPETPAQTAEGDTTEGGEDDATEVVLPEGAKYCEGLTVTTPATGHAYSDEYTTDVEPTCTEDGEKSRHCTNKDCTAKTGSIPVKALGHEFGEKYTVDTNATCSAVGYESIHCTRFDDCGTKKTGSTREIPKTDHTYDDVNGWVVDVRATCTTEGSRHNDCKVCGENGRKTEKIAALGHDIANATLQTKAATCLADGETYKLCERYIETAEGVKKCGEKVVIEELEATGHNVEEWNTEANPATCTTAGSKTGLCQNANCPNEGKLVTETIPATGHKFDTQPTRTEPTCTEPGRLTGTCSVCELENVYNEIPAKGHTWGDWELAPVAEGATADCTVQGGMIRYCTVANCDGSELGKNDEHTVSSWIIGTKATCGTAGEMHTECKVCAKVIETEAIAATGKHDLKETVTLEPTCNEKGSKTVECTADGCNYTATVAIPATGHSYTEWKVFVEPTCTTKGIRQSVCEVCLTTQSEKILALGHDLGEFIVDEPAKCNVKGSQHKECSRCDYTETAEIAALEHKFVGNDCANKCGAKIYEYALVEGSTTDIIITKYNGSDENLVIPAEIDGYKVVAIGNRAFMKTVIVPGTPATETEEATEDTITYVESDFTSLTIPASIAKIGDYAFANSKLTLVNIPATVTTIGKCAFGYDVVITMVPDLEEGETPAEGEEVEYVENIAATQVEDFTIYGVKDSAAEAYAKQDAAEGEEYNFTFVEVKDVYDVVIDEEETNIVEVADGVIFKEFITEDIDENTPAPSIEDQIKAIVVLEDNSTYEVAVEASQTYKDNDDATPDLKFYGTGTKVLVKDGTGNVVDEIVIIVEGDVNGDSVVDAIDCMLIQLATKDAEVLDGVYYTAGNITADSAITADDLNQAVLKIFGEDLVVEKEEETTVTTTAAPTTEPTTEPTTQAPASTEPSTEGTSESTTQAPAESTTQAPAESTTQAPAESTTQTPAESTTQTSGEAA